MKKCPFCKAEIEENARFCLYCMTSLEEKQEIAIPKEKNKRWLVVLAAVLVFVIVVFSIGLALRKDSPDDTSNGASPESQTLLENDSNASTNDTNTIVDDSAQNNDLIAGSQSALSGENGVNQNSTQSNSPTNNANANNNSSANPTTGPTNSGSTTTGNASSDTATSTDSPANSTTPDNSTATQPKYSYIEATIENAYPTGYGTVYAPENAIVITKVNYKEESGNYVIPDTIDGKRVGAIMPFAFCDASISPTVKSVTLPQTVKTIWSNAFRDCYNLTDVYIKSGTIGIYTDAFPETSKRTNTLTIHCAKDCRNFDFYYYRNIAGNYDANYEEWDG